MSRRTLPRFSGRLLALSLSWRETRHAARVSRELLKLYWIVAATYPNLPPREIYRKIVMSRTGANTEDAAAVLRRAQESFAAWPSQRELTFCDVVHYVAVSEYLAKGEQVATRIDMGRVVAEHISDKL